MKILKEINSPLYLQLMELILKKINLGELKEGDKIPPERILSETYKISRATVRQALAELEKNGQIYKLQGKGNFVAKQVIKQELIGFYSFSDEMVKQGKIPGNKILHFILKEAGEFIGTKMNIEPTEKIFVLTRIRLANSEALMYETTYLPYKRFKELEEKDIEQFGLYNTMKNKFGAIFSRAEETFYPCILKEEDSKFLNATSGDCGIIVERFTYENNKIIEFTHSIVRGDKFKYKVILNN